MDNYVIRIEPVLECVYCQSPSSHITPTIISPIFVMLKRPTSKDKLKSKMRVSPAPIYETSTSLDNYSSTGSSSSKLGHYSSMKSAIRRRSSVTRQGKQSNKKQSEYEKLSNIQKLAQKPAQNKDYDKVSRLKKNREAKRKPKRKRSGTVTNYEYLVKNIEDKKSLHQPEGGLSAESVIENIFNNNQQKLKTVVNKEFDDICNVVIPEQQAFEMAPAFKNRYHDIPCLDSSRVPLRNSPTKHDYIHANYVDGYKQSSAYICCQGPKQETAEDFWHMVWQEKVFVIAMLTKCIENERIKCIQYWPVNKEKDVSFGIYRIQCRMNKEFKGYDYAELLLSRESDEHSELRPIVHMLFFGWPDYGIPDDCLQFLSFAQLVRKTQKGFMTKKRLLSEAWKNHPLGPPVVVHCSAGVGRTGTFCAVDICCRKLYETQRIDIAETVRLLRIQRAKSVQTFNQYLFVYLCVVTFSSQIGLLGSTKEENEVLMKAIKNAAEQK